MAAAVHSAGAGGLVTAGNAIREIKHLLQLSGDGVFWIDRWGERFGHLAPTPRAFVESRPDVFVVTEGPGGGFTTQVVQAGRARAPAAPPPPPYPGGRAQGSGAGGAGRPATRVGADHSWVAEVEAQLRDPGNAQGRVWIENFRGRYGNVHRNVAELLSTRPDKFTVHHEGGARFHVTLTAGGRRAPAPPKRTAPVASAKAAGAPATKAPRTKTDPMARGTAPVARVAFPKASTPAPSARMALPVKRKSLAKAEPQEPEAEEEELEAEEADPEAEAEQADLEAEAEEEADLGEAEQADLEADPEFAELEAEMAEMDEVDPEAEQDPDEAANQELAEALEQELADQLLQEITDQLVSQGGTGSCWIEAFGERYGSMGVTMREFLESYPEKFTLNFDPTKGKKFTVSLIG